MKIRIMNNTGNDVKITVMMKYKMRVNSYNVDYIDICHEGHTDSMLDEIDIAMEEEKDEGD